MNVYNEAEMEAAVAEARKRHDTQVMDGIEKVLKQTGRVRRVAYNKLTYHTEAYPQFVTVEIDDTYVTVFESLFAWFAGVDEFMIALKDGVAFMREKGSRGGVMFLKSKKGGD